MSIACQAVIKLAIATLPIIELWRTAMISGDVDGEVSSEPGPSVGRTTDPRLLQINSRDTLSICS